MKMIVTSCLLLLANTAPAQLYFPGTNTWETTTALAAGADTNLLQQAVDFAGTNQTKALVILHNGRILSETYWDGWTQETNGPSYSAAKSVVSVLTGIAIEEGHITSLDQPSADFLSEWAGDATKTNIHIRHHLEMSTGLKENPLHIVLLQLAKNERFYSTGIEAEHTPGTRWYYHNPGYRLLFYILQEATGEYFPDFCDRVLFDPIGIDSSDWEIRVETWFGQSITNFQWLNFPARDAARFGLLALAEGNWDGTQVASQSWFQASAQYQFPGAEWYGRLWWLNDEPMHKIPLEDPLRLGPIAPDVPTDTFMALGKDDQKIYVVPSLGLVVVRLGDAAAASATAISLFDNQLLGRICRAFGYPGRPQPLDIQLSFTNATTTVGVPSWNGRHYKLESRTHLTEGTWQTVPGGSQFEGDGTLKTFNGGNESNTFYKTTTWPGLSP